MLPATAMRSRALCALMLAAAVLGGVDAAKKSQQEEKWHSVRAYSGKPGEQFEIRGEEGIGERVLVHALVGRKLMLRAMRGGKDIELHRADSEKLLRSRAASDAGGKARPQQYLVRVENPVPNGLAAALKKLAAGRVHYLPHDTFLVALADGDVALAGKLAGVREVFYHPDEMKLHTTLLDNSSPKNTNAWGPPASKTSPVRTVTGEAHHTGARKMLSDEAAHHKDAFKHKDGDKRTKQDIEMMMTLEEDPTELKAELAGWVAAIRAETGADVVIEVTSARKCRVTVDVGNERSVARWLARKETVAWLEPRKEVFLLNQWGHQSAQSGDSVGTPMWDRGITGAGQVVGIADTGIDFDNCFFADSTQAVATCIGDGTAAECSNPNHRKIKSYRGWTGTMPTNAPDYVGGHGTHVAGSVAGNAAATNADDEAFAGEYNGVAPQAKIAFDDIGDGDGSLTGIPADLGDLFPHAYAQGARIHSNSWGAADPFYDMMAYECDLFTYDNDDFLILVAAGNAGDSGAMSVGTPATAKNILAVGATDNTVGSLEATWQLQKVVEVNGNIYRALPAAFGPAVAGQVTTLKLASPLDACEALTGDYTNKIALIARGTCDFSIKVYNAQLAGAVAVIVYENTGSEAITMGEGANAELVTIPSVMVNTDAGNTLKSAIVANAQVAATVRAVEGDEFPMTEVSLGDGNLAYFSSWGPTGDMRYKPDVLCVGHKVMSAHSDGDSTSNNCGQAVGTGDGAIGLMSGTSMATPMCAGAAALVRQYYQDGFNNSATGTATTGYNPTAALVKATMINSGMATSYTWQGEVFSPTDFNYRTGYGRVALDQVLSFGAAESGFITSAKDRQTVSPGGAAAYCFRVTGSQRQFKVSIAWTDPPAWFASNQMLTQDLDLVVESGGFGTATREVFLGNNVTVTDESGQRSMRDRLHNTEQVTVVSPVQGGLYSVRVIGAELPEGDQTFALVTTGLMEQVPNGLCAWSACPGNCSGNGICQSGGWCKCAADYSGADCARRHVQIPRDGSPLEISVSALGMSYYSFTMHANDTAYVLTVTGNAGDPDYVFAYNQRPEFGAGWAEVADGGMDASFSNADANVPAGVYVLGVAPWGTIDCAVTVTLSLNGENAPPPTPTPTPPGSPTRPPGLELKTPDAANCKLARSWAQLSSDARMDAAWSGGLGSLIYAGQFETWVCVLYHECTRYEWQSTDGDAEAMNHEDSGSGSGSGSWGGSTGDSWSGDSWGNFTEPDFTVDHMCFIYHEQDKEFLPWGRASDLNFKPLD